MQKAYNVLEQFLILTLLEKQKEIEEARAVLNDLVYLVYISGISKIELEKEPLSYVDPTGLKNYVYISMYPGGVHTQGTSFTDAAKTRINELKNSEGFDSQNDKIYHFEVRSKNQLISIINDGNIDNLEIFGHSTAKGLVTGEDPKNFFQAKDLNKLNKEAFNKNAEIKFHGCNTARRKGLKIWEKNISQEFARYFEGVKVFGFVAGATKVPSKDATIDYNYEHKSGNNVWFKTRGYVRSYQKIDGSMKKINYKDRQTHE